MTSDSETKFVCIVNSCNYCLLLADHGETVLYVNGCMRSKSMTDCLVAVCSHKGGVMLWCVVKSCNYKHIDISIGFTRLTSSYLLCSGTIVVTNGVHYTPKTWSNIRCRSTFSTIYIKLGLAWLCMIVLHCYMALFPKANIFPSCCLVSLALVLRQLRVNQSI